MSEKLKVAFVVGQFPMLSETFIINQATGLLDRGCEVSIYTEKLCDTTHVHPDIVRYGLLSHTYVLPKVSENYGIRLLQGLKHVWRYGFRFPRKMLRSLNVFRYGMRAMSLWLLLTTVPSPDHEPYDVIHAQFGTLGFRGLLLRELNPGSRLVVMFRGFDISRWIKTKGDRVYDSLFRQADFFLTNCNFFREKLLAIGCPPEKLKVHYSGLDCSKFEPTERCFDESDEVRIAATGRLVEKKGFEYCIRAVAKVVEQYPNALFEIIGDGPLRSELSALIESLKMTGKIRLLGWKNEAEIVDILTCAHLFVAPSVTAENGNQDAPINVLKEAMALGLPVVSTYHGGIPELVENGVSGLLVPERDTEALAQALIQLIHQPERWHEMGRAGRTHVEDYYNLTVLNDRLLKLYQQLTSLSSSGTDTHLTAPLHSTHPYIQSVR